MGEVDGDLAADAGLHLSNAPIGVIGVAHTHAGCQYGIEVAHGWLANTDRDAEKEKIMGESNINLAALIGSRICHDLISPIGAITNGLELLDLVGGAQGPEMDLIADSAGNAGARIRFFRIAYGDAGDQMLGRAEIVSVLDDIGRGGRLKMLWAPLDPQPRGEVRLAFLVLQCLETAMPYGGTARIVAQDGVWTLTGSADKVNVDDALWSGLDGSGATVTITPALVQFALLPQVAADMGRKVRFDHENGQITVQF